MGIISLEPGVAHYFIYKGACPDPESIREKKANHSIVQQEVLGECLKWAALGAGAIIAVALGATVIEDVLSGGVGIMDDIPTLIGASWLAYEAMQLAV